MHATGLVTLFLALVSVTSAAPTPKRSGTGDFTFYDPGLGACGKTNKSSDLIVAVSSQVFASFGKQISNGNPVCGKKITLKANGKTVTATVEDKCPGCGANDVDLSPAAFKKLASLGTGRIHGAKWTIS
ncbi:hypothetical protein M422DRAFT_24350 [Sphaerobolus stellatus SS14]|nr:hypothetical protein M422DRAFT_24350 [Sphaerobolus stellatus SS14]